MPDSERSTPPADPFTQFWMDMMSRMAAAGAAPASAEWFKQMRKPFFDAMAQHAEEFMRSEQFLTAMKQAMDNALAVKQQVDQFLTKNVQALQMPSSSDVDHIVLVMRGMEERLLGKLDELTGRIERLERAQDESARSAATGTRSESPRTAGKRSGR